LPEIKRWNNLLQGYISASHFYQQMLKQLDYTLYQ